MYSVDIVGPIPSPREKCTTYDLAEHTAKIFVAQFGYPATIKNFEANRVEALVRRRPTNYFSEFSGEEPSVEVIKNHERSSS